MLFLLKIAVSPILVALVSVAARWWGPTIGALLMGLPWLTGPVLYFLATDKGTDFGVAACAGIELGVVCICAFMLAYGAATAFAPWPVCLAAAAAAFAAAAWAMQGLEIALDHLGGGCCGVPRRYLPAAAAAAHRRPAWPPAVVGYPGAHAGDLGAGGRHLARRRRLGAAAFRHRLDLSRHRYGDRLVHPSSMGARRGAPHAARSGAVVAGVRGVLLDRGRNAGRGRRNDGVRARYGVGAPVSAVLLALNRWRTVR